MFETLEKLEALVIQAEAAGPMQKMGIAQEAVKTSVVFMRELAERVKQLEGKSDG